jgi:flavodoxin
MKKTLVAYFSASGVTAEAAKKLAKAAGADLYEIKPAVPYTDKDLDWRNEQTRSSVEMRSKASRPALADNNADISQYDTIYLGFPIWWYVAPTIINSFLESYDFSGKTIILFATSGGSGFGSTAKNLKSSVASDTNIIEGKINNMSDESLRTWIESLNI